MARGRWAAAVTIDVALLLGGCGDDRAVDPLTQRLADICGLDPHDLSYSSRGANGYGGPPPYVWQTQDARHSVQLNFRAGVPLDQDPRVMYVSCDYGDERRPIRIDRYRLPEDGG